MARIFISHSSSDNDLARALRDWLNAEGWDDIFLDFDPERGIVAGEKWETALLDAAARCEAVLFVVTRNWLNSGWCLKEFHLAEKLNKRVFMLLVDGLKVQDLPAELTAEWQLVDLAPGADHVAFSVVDGIRAQPREVRFSSPGLRRLRSGLTRAGLDPLFFAWPPPHDPNRPAYMGLRPLDVDDAGIFFGREAQTISVLDRMRGLREAAPPRFLAILGASGAGKSSLLRAGLIPRLQRDDRHFHPLPVIRPERAVMTGENGFVRALAIALGAAGLGAAGLGATAEQMLELMASPVAMRAALAALAEAARAPTAPGEPAVRPPTLILPIDQGEELFLAEGAEEAAKFLQILGELLVSSEFSLAVLIAIRSDSYERLQTVPQLESIRQETFSLPPMLRSAYESVIQGPALRLAQSGRKFVIEPALTQALLADIEAGGAKDALPLLAFTLELLFAKKGQDGRLTLADYLTLGGIKGSIEAAVELAMVVADSDPRIPQDRAQRLALIRRAFIPWLAGVDRASNTIRRRVARLAEVPAEARPLVECLIKVRLLSTDVTFGGDVTVEPAHEALLRQWGLLQGWLEEDFAALAVLEGVQRGARDWEANLRNAEWVVHSAGRLEDAEASGSSHSLREFLSTTEKEYLAVCRTAENARRNREIEEARRLAESREQTVRRTRIGLVAALVLAAAAGAAGWYAMLQRDEANRQASVARSEERKARASLSMVRAREARSAGDVPLAASRALAGYSTLANSETRTVLLEAGLGIDPHLEAAMPAAPDESVSALAWLEPSVIAVATKTGSAAELHLVRLRPDGPPQRVARLPISKLMYDAEEEATIIALTALPDGSIMSARNNGAIETHDGGTVRTWRPPARALGYAYDRAAISADGTQVVFGGESEAAFVNCAPGAAGINALSCAAEEAMPGHATAVTVQVSAAEGVVGFSDGSLIVGGGMRPRKRFSLPDGEAVIRALAVAGEMFAAIVQPAGDSIDEAKVVLLERTGDELTVRARSPAKIGSSATLTWRRAGRELVHGCLTSEQKSGPLCATQLEDDKGSLKFGATTRLLGHSTGADLVAVSADRMRVASRALDGVKSWRWPADRSIHAYPASPPPGGFASLTASPDVRSILLSARSGATLLLDPALDPEEQNRLPLTGDGLIDAIEVAGGRVIAQDAKLSFVENGATTPARRIDLPASVLPQGGLVWTGQERVVAVALADQHIALIDFGGDPVVLKDFTRPTDTFAPFGITVDLKRHHLVASDTDGRIHLFDLGTRVPVGVLTNTHSPNIASLLGAEGLAVSPDGSKLATTAAGNQIVLYDLERRTSIAVLNTAKDDTKSVAFDQAGKRLAAIDQNNNVSLWSVSGSAPERWLDVNLGLPQPSLSTTLPRVMFTSGGALLALTAASEIVYLSLDEAAWVRRIEALGYDKTKDAP
jgi:DNA-binding beta-propeller fold protein YncE